jgi:hypothetical protein
MNWSALDTELFKHLKLDLVDRYEDEYEDETLMSYDTQQEAIRILSPMATHLDLKIEELWPEDIDRLTRSQWINICALFLADWNSTLENRVADADDDQEMHYQLILVKDVFFESAVLVLQDDPQMLDITIGYLRDFTAMYQRNCKARSQYEARRNF